MANKEKRFETIYTQGTSLSIVVDTETGVNYKQSGTSGTPEWQSILRGLLLLHSASALSGRTERSADSLRLLPSGTPHRMPAGSLDKVNRCSG